MEKCDCHLVERQVCDICQGLRIKTLTAETDQNEYETRPVTLLPGTYCISLADRKPYDLVITETQTIYFKFKKYGHINKQSKDKE